MTESQKAQTKSKSHLPAQAGKPKAKKADQPTPSLAIADNTVLTLTIGPDKAKQAYQATLKKVANNFKAQGFRQGKAPIKIVEENIGREKLIQLALEDILPQEYNELIKNENRIPLTQPEIKLVSADDTTGWKLELQIAEKPEIKLGNYQATVKKGHQAAQTEISAKQKELKAAQKESTDKKDKTPPPEKLEDSQVEELTLRNIFQALVSDLQPQIPELLIKEDVKKQLEELSHQLEHFKMDFDQYLQRRGITFEQLTSEMAIGALSTFQVEFILDEIMKTQKFTVTETDIEAYLKKIHSTKKVAEVDAHTRSHFEYAILRQKVVNYLLNLN